MLLMLLQFRQFHRLICRLQFFKCTAECSREGCKIRHLCLPRVCFHVGSLEGVFSHRAKLSTAKPSVRHATIQITSANGRRVPVAPYSVPPLLEQSVHGELRLSKCRRLPRFAQDGHDYARESRRILQILQELGIYHSHVGTRICLVMTKFSKLVVRKNFVRF